MGSLCCCPCNDEYEEYTYSGNSVYRHCLCLRFFFYQLLSRYGAMFHRLESRSASPNQGGTTLQSTGIGTTSASPNQGGITLASTDPRYTRLQCDGLVSRKSMSHFQEESLPLRRNMSSSGKESLGFGKKWNGIDSENNSKLGHSEPLEIDLATKSTYGLAYLQQASEDEDVCPTCLDEYCAENPKITTQCSHHFHLGCIYEWLERSESCPICGKEMEFCESP